MVQVERGQTSVLHFVSSVITKRKLPLPIALSHVAFVELEGGQKNQENDTLRPSKCN